MEATITSPPAGPSALAPRLPLVNLVPAVLVIAAAAVLVLSNGGYAASTWYPVAIFLLALLAVTVLAAPVNTTWPRSITVALGALALFAGWCYLTIGWALVPGLAWDAGNRVVLYLLVLGIAVLRPWPATAARLAVGAIVAVLTLLAIGLLAATAWKTDPGPMFEESRLASPTGYSNATPTLLLMGALPALWLAVDRALPVAARAAALAAAGLLVETALLSQSRGAVVALVVGLVTLVAAAPRRWPVLLATAAVGAALAATWGPLVDVRDAGASAGALHNARVAIALSCMVLLVVGALAAFADQERRLPFVVRRMGDDRLIVVLIVLVLGGAAAATGNPGHWISARWDDFKQGRYAKVEQGQNRFTGGLGSNRYDFYRVALDDFRARPVVGVGADGFGPTYLRHGRSGESPRYAHSLPFALLGETGLIGTLLFAVFLVAAVVAVARGPRAGPRAAGAACFGTFLGGCLFDWLWQFPALGVIGFLAVGVAARTGTDVGAPAPAKAHRRPLPAMARAATGAVVLAVALSFALPGIAARFVSAAYATSAKNPALAVSRLRRAESLNPLSADAPLARGIVLRRLGRLDDARGAFDEAIRREPDNWFAYFERALISGLQRRWPAGAADLSEAQRLNPRQRVIESAARLLASHRAADPESAERALAAQLAAKLHRNG